MDEIRQDSVRRAVLARLAADVHAAARAVADASHMSLSAYVASAVERDLLARLDGLRREAGR